MNDTDISNPYKTPRTPKTKPVKPTTAPLEKSKKSISKFTLNMIKKIMVKLTGRSEFKLPIIPNIKDPNADGHITEPFGKP